MARIDPLQSCSVYVITKADLVGVAQTIEGFLIKALLTRRHLDRSARSRQVGADRRLPIGASLLGCSEGGGRCPWRLLARYDLSGILQWPWDVNGYFRAAFQRVDFPWGAAHPFSLSTLLSASQTVPRRPKAPHRIFLSCSVPPVYSKARLTEVQLCIALNAEFRLQIAPPFAGAVGPICLSFPRR